MLILHERFDNIPVMSLQTGAELARTSRAIIDPRNLTVVAYELDGPLLTQQPSLLLIDDIREVGPLGIIIDSTDELIHPDDVVKIGEIYSFYFNLIGIRVVDDRQKKVGKVTGYSIDATSFEIQQLNVKRPFMQSFNETELLVHRSQVVKVSDEEMIVKSPTVRHTQTVAVQSHNFNNPFRKTTSSQPETIDN